MSERIRGSYDDALYKSTYTSLYFTNDGEDEDEDDDDVVLSVVTVAGTDGYSQADGFRFHADRTVLA